MTRRTTRAMLTDPELAARVGDTRYIATDQKCTMCGCENPAFYVAAPGVCVTCQSVAWREQLGPDHPTGRRSCLLAGLDYWVEEIPRLCPNGPHGLRHDRYSDRCLTCEDQRRQARREGHGVTLSGKPDGRYRDTPAPAMDRQTAASLGFVRYTGLRCARGHNGVRYVSTGGCVACLRARR